MNRIFIITLMIGRAVAQDPAIDTTGRRGVLNIVLLDSFGGPVEGGAKLTVERFVDGKWGAPMRIQRTETLDYGTYRLMVKGSPAYPVEKRIEINDPATYVVVTLYVAPIEMPWPGNYVRGALPTEANEKGCRIVKLVSPLAEENTMVTKAMLSGQFAIENIRPGKYLVITIGPAGMCETYETTVFAEREQDIKIIRLQYGGTK